MTAPNNEETLLLELINETRLYPLTSSQRYIASFESGTARQGNIQNAIDFFGVDMDALYDQYAALVPTGPLAWSTELASAAHKHSAAMIAADQQGHELPGEPGLGPRVSAEGYQYSWLRENVYAYSDDILYAHAGFMIDWGYDDVDYTNGNRNSNFASTGDGMQDALGHREALLDPTVLEVGIDITYENNSATEVGPQIITQDFGTRGDYFVTGVVYTDNDDDNFYSVGEGRGDLTVKVGQTSTSAWASGAYRAELAKGTNSFELSGGGLAGTVFVTTTIDDLNIKIDVVDGNTIRTSGSIDVTGPISKIVGLGLLALTLKAGSGSQEFHGTINNDIFDGGAGEDIAVYVAPHTSYTVTKVGSDIRISGPGAGTDTTRSIEVFRFSDGDYIFNQNTGSLQPAGSAGSNSSPVVTASKAVSTSAGTTITFEVGASDPDGDPLSYSVTNPGNGTAAVTTSGFITYTPDQGFSGQDEFAVSVTDGKGGLAAMSVSVSVAAALAAPDGPGFNLFTPQAFFGTIGGIGNVFGTAAEESIRVTGKPDNIVFDPSFNGGGDEIVFPGIASGYSVHLEGSQAIIGSSSSVYAIPIGPNTTILTFTDGGRSLRYDTVAKQVKIASQVITDTPATISGAADNPLGPDAISPEFARLQLSPDAMVDVSGQYSIFGTGNGEETISYTNGNLILDPSFNGGGDELQVPGPISLWSAYINGSSVLLISSRGDIQIPVGTNGMTISFGGSDRILRYDTGEGALKIGDEIITATSRANAQQLGGAGAGSGSGSGSPIDAGSTNVAAVVTLDDSESYALVDNVSILTNVVIENFNADDQIIVQGATSSQYSFGAAAKDPDGIPNDLSISFNDGTNFTSMTIKNIVGSGFVYDEASAEAAVGWNFISFG
ncbi:MAG: Ig-like domain-containing protein [Sphingomonadaceae bacterium]